MKYINKDHEAAANLHSKGEFDKAILAYEKVLEAFPNHPDVLSDRGTTYLLMEKYNLAIIDFNEAVNLEPNRAFRYSARAFAKDRMGDLDGAIADYQKAIELDPEDAIAYNNLGVLMENRGMRKQANTLYQFADKINNEHNQAFTPPIKTEEKIEKGPTEAFQTFENENPSKQDIYKSLLTRSGLKDFFRFVFNGFKLPKK
ncbi:tetratricopeptide repeat protein [Luteibaculum oceani]|uniref:Tetratricopeptide repeat protein n=1 Tax=Luteibaculum oceani TaxID=1294296 RepID=A0A5C6V9U8_9FLAO|nr:tetratricopeptide repeat protein [Luteibaculum oceani]TXC81504.1 tetratricopeptide repeat protein [Luteibaculum oceani]